MATYFARATGNINGAIWATTPAGAGTTVTFASGDVLLANSFTVTINVTTNLGSTGEIRNDTTGGATAGGGFTLSAGVTLTGNIVQGATTGGGTILAVSYASPSSASVVGNVTSPTNTSGNARTISITSTGTLNFTGNATGDNRATVGGGSISLQGGGILNFVGNAYGGTGTTGQAIEISSASAVVNMTGNAYGGGGPAIYNAAGGTLNLTGTAYGSITTGSGSGVTNASSGTMRITRAVGNAYGPGNTAGLSSAVGAINSGLGVIEVEQLEYGTFGQSPTSGTGIRLKKLGSNVAVFNYVDSGSAKTLIDATQANQPAITDVRSGVSYASGALTGTCAVPAAGSVALGVPVGNTTGTAVLTPEAVWSAATRTLTADLGPTAAQIRQEIDANSTKLDVAVSSRLAPSGTLATVTNLTNAPASVTPSDIWGYASRTLTSASGPTAVQIRQEMDSNSTKLANLDTTVSSRLAGSAYTAPTTPPTAAAVASQVRTELGTELGRIDAAISTRATPANIPTADITAIKAKTDALNTTRLAQVSTTEIVGGLLAQANS